jgi:hypothetical protein
MDPLTQALVDRALQSQGGTGNTPPPPSVLPNPATKVPQQAKRFENAQQIQEAYRNDWNPNPILLRAQLGHR